MTFRKFNHPNIVKILAVCVDNDPVFIVMELMPAGDLLKFLRDARPESVSCLFGCLHIEDQNQSIITGSSITDTRRATSDHYWYSTRLPLLGTSAFYSP